MSLIFLFNDLLILVQVIGNKIKFPDNTETIKDKFLRKDFASTH